MANQLLINPFPCGVSNSQHFQELNGSIQLAGSAVTTGEPINWNDLISGIGYNEVNYLGNGVNGNGTALVTAFSGDGTTVTATAVNNFSIGQKVRFKGNTTAMGLLLNGVSVTVATASSSQFTFLNSANTTGSGEVGLAIVDATVHPYSLGPNHPFNITVTAVSASGTVGTATAANNLLPGSQVTFGTFTTGTLGPKLVSAGTMTVLNSTSTAFTFQMPSALTGTTGASTAVGINPIQPFSVIFWSDAGTGYEYTYSSATGTMFVNVVPLASALTVTLPLTNLAAAAYPAGVLGDVIKFTAKFPKMYQV